MSTTYHCHCPTHGDEYADGRDYTEGEAECAEIAAARYALFFAKRFCNRSLHAYHVYVTVQWGGEVGDTPFVVCVDVKQDNETLWGWRVCGIARQ